MTTPASTPILALEPDCLKRNSANCYGGMGMGGEKGTSSQKHFGVRQIRCGVWEGGGRGTGTGVNGTSIERKC